MSGLAFDPRAAVRHLRASDPALARVIAAVGPCVWGTTSVRGIGRWTAEMLLMFRLGRPDVLPVDDYGIRKRFAVVMRKRVLPSRAEIEARGERWRPYRTVASWYLWRAAESAAK